jgi:hypothetical protein
MGLTIHYKLSVEKDLAVVVVRELVERTARFARKIGCAEVSDILRADGDVKCAPLFVSVGRPEDGCFGHVPPARGWLVEVWPGKGCESATLGLCQYPRRIPYRAKSVATGFAGGWRLQGFCKTQYAGEHGWEHFLICHKRIVSLLDFWRELGVTVEVSDEGGYWETRSEDNLRAALQRYDDLVAAVGGMFKDASDNSGGNLSVESPIFDYANFERLEHEGRQEFGRQVEQLRKETGKGIFLDD